MKINELLNLWSAFNIKENFRILIYAKDISEAQKVAVQYKIDTNMDGDFVIEDDFKLDSNFDCDYVISYNGTIKTNYK